MQRSGSVAEAICQSARLHSDFGYGVPMPATVQLDEMTVPEKLQPMEAIWADLSRDADALETPDWHREVPAERERRIQSGEAHFSDWEQAKADVRK
jgi:hypothetical protein